MHTPALPARFAQLRLRDLMLLEQAFEREHPEQLDQVLAELRH